MSDAISFRDVRHRLFPDGISWTVETGSSVLVVTSRADGGAALTRLATGLSRPAGGSVLIDGQDLAALDPDQVRRLRCRIGVVPADGGLISNLKLWENITLPLMYHSGTVTEEQERNGLAILEQLGYTGSPMAMPAHLAVWEKRAAALARMHLCRPAITIYGNSLDDLPPAARGAFCRIAGEFHAADPARTSVFLSTSSDLAGELPVDRVIRLDGPGGPFARPA